MVQQLIGNGTVFITVVAVPPNVKVIDSGLVEEEEGVDLDLVEKIRCLKGGWCLGGEGRSKDFNFILVINRLEFSMAGSFAIQYFLPFWTTLDPFSPLPSSCLDVFRG